MGRITVFSLDDCPHCVRTKIALTKRNIPYLEISLTKYPQKRNDMLSLSDKLTVPQIFANSTHVGGADDTLKLLASWDANAEGITPRLLYEETIASQTDPTDPRLQPSNDPPVVETAPPARNPNVIKVPTVLDTTMADGEKKGSTMSVLAMTELLKRRLPRQELKHNFTSYKNAFKGSDFYDVLVQEFGLTRMSAATFAHSLQRVHRVVLHVSNDNHTIEDTTDLYFRLQCDQTPAILNSYRIWTERVDRDAMSLLKRLKKQLNAILSDHTNVDSKINYKAAAKHPNFAAFDEAACELQGVDYENMPYPKKLAFSINLYNFMIKYAFTKVGIGATDLGRNAFFNTVSLQVGGSSGRAYVLTFQELENGVMRGNRKAPYALSRPFGSNDDRLKLVMPRVDNRIHFALNCGASSCPPVKNFTEEGVEEELRIVAQAFCEDDNNVRIDGNTLYLSKILNWYIEDFGGSTTESAVSVLKFLRGDKAKALKALIPSGSIKVRYNPYDWQTDASDFVPFSGSAVKAVATRFPIFL